MSGTENRSFIFPDDSDYDKKSNYVEKLKNSVKSAIQLQEIVKKNKVCVVADPSISQLDGICPSIEILDTNLRNQQTFKMGNTKEAMQ